MKIIRVNGPNVIRIGDIISTIGEAIEVDEITAAAILAKTSTTFKISGADGPVKRGKK